MARISGIQYGLRGIDIVMSNLQKELVRYNIKGKAGLIRAAILIRQDMENTSPTIPLDTGNLRASWFVVTSTGPVKSTGSNFKGKDAAKVRADTQRAKSLGESISKSFPFPVVVIGFGANYAWFVHENVGANFGKHREGVDTTKFSRGDPGAKFFEAALNRNKEKIIHVIKQAM